MKDFCLFACSDQFRDPGKGLEFVRVIHNLSQQLGVELKHFDYAIDEENASESPNEGRFDSDEVDRLNRVLAEKPILSIGLWSDSDEHSYYDLQSELINTGRTNNFTSLYVQFPMRYVHSLTVPALVSWVSHLLLALNHSAQLDYALVTTMEPSLSNTYFRNIFTSSLRDDEALDLATWERKLDERKTKLRGLYWGNFLSPGHLSQLRDKQAFVRRLLALIGSERLVIMDSNALFFMLPSPNRASDPIWDPVESLLKEQDLLMQPDDEAKERVKSFFALSQQR